MLTFFTIICLIVPFLLFIYLFKKRGIKNLEKSVDKEQEIMSQISNEVFLGGVGSINDLEILKAKNIGYIIIVNPFIKPKFENSGLKYLQIKIADNPTALIGIHFQNAYDFIENGISNGKNVLILCQMGISRSATVTCSYFMKKNNLSFNDAFEFVKKGRRIIDPNSAFRHQLELFHYFKFDEKLNWYEIMNKTMTKFEDQESIEIWDSKKKNWIEGIFLLKYSNALFFDVKVGDQIISTNRGMARRNIKKIFT